jgi:acyl dehydratase
MNAFPPDPRIFRFAEISVGEKHELDYAITVETYQKFLSTFGDHSPIHVDQEFSRARGFENCVAHGAILNGFISHFIGMHFPGRFSLLLAVDLRFSNASYPGDFIRLSARVTQKLESRKVVVIDLLATNTTRNQVAARGRIQVMLREDA